MKKKQQYKYAGADQGSDRELVLERGQFWNKFWRGAIFIKKYQKQHAYAK
jgi:hypothetical protein